MSREQSKFLTRLIIFSITLIGFLVFVSFDFSTNNKYDYESSYFPITWFLFWTQLSNIGALIWITIAFISSIIKSDKLEKIVNGWFFKNLVFTSILVTGLLFSIVYIPIIIKFSKPGIIDEIHGNASTFYRVMLIIGTTFKHVLIPGMFLFLSIVDKQYTKDKMNMTILKKVMIIFIIPCLYFVYIILVTSLGAPAPYPILDFSSGNFKLWEIFLFLIINIFIATIFCFISYIQFWKFEKISKK
ncbi:MAG: hypothetical protein HRS50_01215 [Mycoplasmataceae bacterium]|nr:hypothetical protein [Mycoplasmataceae bacterium]